MLFLRSESLYNNGFWNFWSFSIYQNWCRKSLNTTRLIVSEIQKIADFFKMAPTNGHWPKWNISKLEMLSSPRRITYLNYLEIEFLWNYCNLYAVYCCYEKRFRFRFRLSCFDEFFLTLMSEGASSSSAGGGSLFTFEKCTWLTGRPRLCSSSGLSWSWPEVAFGGSISTSMWILIGEDCWKKRYSFKGLTQMIQDFWAMSYCVFNFHLAVFEYILRSLLGFISNHFLSYLRKRSYFSVNRHICGKTAQIPTVYIWFIYIQWIQGYWAKNFVDFLGKYLS